MILLFTLLAAVSSFASDMVHASLSLAVDLASEDLHDLSALEFRRCSALTTGSADKDSGDRAGFLTAAAWEYRNADMPELSQKMLDKAEAESRAAHNAALLMRGEIALEQRRLSESEFFFSTLEGSNAEDNYKTVAQSRLALVALKQNNLDEARMHLEAASSTRALGALSVMASTRDRSPRLGGALGMLPGLGYAYSGEYANCLRSIILNGIFLYAMKETGDRDQWGAFTALTFFELTWYTGSIYGGIDAAHRFNQRRENAVSDAIRQEYDYQLDLKAVPSVTVEFSF